MPPSTEGKEQRDMPRKRCSAFEKRSDYHDLPESCSAKAGALVSPCRRAARSVRTSGRSGRRSFPWIVAALLSRMLVATEIVPSCPVSSCSTGRSARPEARAPALPWRWLLRSEVLLGIPRWGRARVIWWRWIVVVSVAAKTTPATSGPSPDTVLSHASDNAPND